MRAGSSPPTVPGAMLAHASTDRGRERAENEDSFAIATLTRSTAHGDSGAEGAEESPRAHVLAVADGLGGGPGGRLASRLAVGHAVRSVLSSPALWEDPPGEALGARLERIPEEVQGVFRRRADEDPTGRGMGTTLTLACITWPRLHVVHVGDSRCYLRTRDGLCRLTRDHTLAGMFAEDDDLDPIGLGEADMDSVLWNAVSAETPLVRPDLRTRELVQDEDLLLCTDGVYKHVSDREIEAVLRSESTPRQACHALIAAANDAGTTDDATAIVARFPAAAPAGSCRRTAFLPRRLRRRPRPAPSSTTRGGRLES